MDQIDRLERLIAQVSEHFSDYHITVKLNDGTVLSKITDSNWSYGIMKRWVKDIEFMDNLNVEDRRGGRCDE